MSNVNRFWLAAALWALAVCSVAVVLGVSSWGGGVTLALSGITPIVIARRFWGVPEPSLSQSIQRELR